MQRMLFGMFTATVLAITAGTALANDRDVRAKTVPASICQPSNSTQLGMVQIVHGSWVFQGSATGTVEIWCPLSLNQYTVSDNTNDNDISYYRVFYRDSDSAGAAAQVTVRLFYRRASAQAPQPTGELFNSNAVSSPVPFNTSRYHSNPHDVFFFPDGVLYFFRVTLTRNNSTQDPAFHGIDFEIPPVG
jgi:hypothetical protein